MSLAGFGAVFVNRGNWRAEPGTYDEQLSWGKVSLWSGKQAKETAVPSPRVSSSWVTLRVSWGL